MIPHLLILAETADPEKVSAMASVVEKYGAGVVCIGIVVTAFILLFKHMLKQNNDLLNRIIESQENNKSDNSASPNNNCCNYREPMDKDELKDFIIEIVQQQVRILTEEKNVDVLNNYIKINDRVKPCIERIKNDFKADRVAAYVFHNGTHSSHGLPFYKYTCVSESIRRDAGITQVLNDQRALPLSMIDDEITLMLNRDGWFIIPNADTLIDSYPIVIGQMGRNKLKAAIGVSVYGPDQEILGFVVVEFKESQTCETLEGLVCRVKDRCDSLTSVFDFRRNKEDILGNSDQI